MLYLLPHAWRGVDTATMGSREYPLKRMTEFQVHACPRNSEEKTAHGGLRSFQEACIGNERYGIGDYRK